MRSGEHVPDRWPACDALADLRPRTRAGLIAKARATRSAVRVGATAFRCVEERLTDALLDDIAEGMPA